MATDTLLNDETSEIECAFGSTGGVPQMLYLIALSMPWPSM